MMKKKLAIGIALILLISCVSVTFAFAGTQHSAGIYGKKMTTGYTLKMKKTNGNNDVEVYPVSGVRSADGASARAMSFFDSVEKMDFSFKGTANTQYMVFLLKPQSDGAASTVPSSSNLSYIDQVASSSNGDVEFSIYPSQLTTSGKYSVYISSSNNAYQLVGNFFVANWAETEYKLGDCDGDTEVGSLDALSILQHSVSPLLTGNNRLAADVDGNNTVDPMDALAVLQYSVKMIDSFVSDYLYAEGE